MTITSTELKHCQDVLEKLSKQEIDNPMTNYTRLNKLLSITKHVDKIRREAWNEEKFSTSENIVNMVCNNFTADDIPF